MKKFNTETENKIEKLLDESSEYYGDGKINEAGEKLIMAYNTIPEPRVEYNESYNYCSYVLDFILDEEYELANGFKWLKELKKIADSQKTWEGSYEFYAGKTNFVLRNFGEAKIFFDKCVEIGKGYRYFEDEDPKYLEFYKNPEKYM